MTQRLPDIAADIPLDLVDADETLVSYGRWATTGGRGGRSPTVDRQFRPEMDRHESYSSFMDRCTRPPREVMMPTRNAMIVQRTLARLPDRERIVLAALYVPRRIPAAQQLQILKIPPSHSRVLHLLGLRRFDAWHRSALKDPER
jgi:hypothetical protein